MNYLKDPRQYNRVSRILSLLFWALTTTVQAQDYTYTTNNGTITIIRYTGVGGEVTVPGSINGLCVTTIGAGAFASTAVRSILLPETVTNIEDYAFQYCSELTNGAIYFTDPESSKYPSRSYRIRSPQVPKSPCAAQENRFVIVRGKSVDHRSWLTPASLAPLPSPDYVTDLCG